MAQVKDSFKIIKSNFLWCGFRLMLMIIISALYGQIALSITIKEREDNSVCVMQAVDAQ